MMALRELQYFPLAEASLCEDCGHVVQSLSLCACGSVALLPLARVLNRSSDQRSGNSDQVSGLDVSTPVIESLGFVGLRLIGE